MYRVYIDYNHSTKSGKIMHSPELAASGYVLIDPKCTREVNGAGGLTFSIAKDHPYRYAFTRMQTIFTVVDVDSQFNETCIWQGRCLSDETDQYGTCSVECEGEYAYFNDTFTFESDPNGVYEPEDDEEEIDVRIPLWLYVACVVAEHNIESLSNKQILFDAIVDITDIKSSMADYISYAGTWLDISGASIWAHEINSGTYPITSANWVHVYTTTADDGRWTTVAIVAVPDGMSSYQNYYGCDVEPKDDPTIELNITSHDKHKSVLENFADTYKGYMNVTDHWVRFKRTQWEIDHDTGTVPFRAPFTETKGVGTYMPVLTYLREPGDYIETSPLSFGKEISDLSVNVDCANVVNVLIPTASEIGDEEDSDYWDGTLRTINDNLEYIKADTSIDTFGQIWGTNDWGEDVKDVNTLMIRGISYLEEHMAPEWSIDMKVIDPSFVDMSKDTLNYGNRYPIYVEPLEIETSFILVKEVLDLTDPSDNTYEFYTTIGVFTDVELQNGGKDEYRMNAVFASYCANFIAKYPTESSGFFVALKAAMSLATPIPIDVRYGSNRVDFDSSTYKTATETVTYNGTDYLCNKYYCYPTVAPWCRNTPFGSASFMLIVLYNSSTGHKYQVAFNPFSYTYFLYREYTANNVQVRSSKTVSGTTNTRNWAKADGVNWPNSSSSTKVGSITISGQPQNFPSEAGVYPTFDCTATSTAGGLKYQWYARASSTGTWRTVSSNWSGATTNTITNTRVTSDQMVGWRYRCKISDSTGTVAYTNEAIVT